jgi:hypothetical protein
VSGNLHDLATSPSVKSSRYLLNRRMDVHQNRCGRGNEENRSYHGPSQESNLGYPVRSLVIVLSELQQFLLDVYGKVKLSPCILDLGTVRK